MTPKIVAAFLSTLSNSNKFSSQGLILESLNIFRVFTLSSYSVLAQRPQDWLPRTIYSLVDSNIQVRHKALLVLQECLKRPRDTRIARTIVQVFRKPLDNDKTSSVMLIDMFRVAFENFFSHSETARPAALLWATLPRLIQAWGVNERFEDWEYYNTWIAIAQAVFEKGIPSAQVQMLQAWRDYIYISAEFPLSMELANLSETKQHTKSIVTLMRPLRLLLSTSSAVYAQADQCSIHILYSCLNPAFINSFNNTAELDVFWTDVVETCIRLYLKEGPRQTHRRNRLLEILPTLFRIEPVHTPSTPISYISNSPSKTMLSWNASTLTESHIDLNRIPALPPRWVRSKSHIIIADLLNTVFPQLSLDVDPWASTWNNFIALTCQQMYREQKTSSKLSGDSYNILRTIMNGTVQILDQNNSVVLANDDQVLHSLVNVCEPVLVQLLKENMIFSVSVTGPYIMRCTSPTGTVSKSVSQDTFDINPVILLWTIIMKFTQKLRVSFGTDHSKFAYMKLLKLLLAFPSKTLLADITTVLVNMTYSPAFPIEPLWTCIYEATKITENTTSLDDPQLVTVNNMIRLHSFAKVQNPSPERDLGLRYWTILLTLYTNAWFSAGLMSSFMKDVAGVYSNDILISSGSKLSSSAVVLFYFVTNLLKINVTKPEIWQSLNTDHANWTSFLELVSKVMNTAATDRTFVTFDTLLDFLKSLFESIDSYAALPPSLLREILVFTEGQSESATIVRGLLITSLSNLEGLGPQQTITGNQYIYDWPAATHEFIKSCLSLDNLFGLECRYALEIFASRHSRNAVPADLLELKGSLSSEQRKQAILNRRMCAPPKHLLLTLPSHGAIVSCTKAGISQLPPVADVIPDIKEDILLERPKPQVIAIDVDEENEDVDMDDNFEDALEHAEEPKHVEIEDQDMADTQVISPYSMSALDGPQSESVSVPDFESEPEVEPEVAKLASHTEPHQKGPAQTEVISEHEQSKRHDSQIGAAIELTDNRGLSKLDATDTMKNPLLAAVATDESKSTSASVVKDKRKAAKRQEKSKITPATDRIHRVRDNNGLPITSRSQSPVASAPPPSNPVSVDSAPATEKNVPAAKSRSLLATKPSPAPSFVAKKSASLSEVTDGSVPPRRRTRNSSKGFLSAEIILHDSDSDEEVTVQSVTNQGPTEVNEIDSLKPASEELSMAAANEAAKVLLDMSGVSAIASPAVPEVVPIPSAPEENSAKLAQIPETTGVMNDVPVVKDESVPADSEPLLDVDMAMVPKKIPAPVADVDLAGETLALVAPPSIVPIATLESPTTLVSKKHAKNKVGRPAKRKYLELEEPNDTISSSNDNSTKNNNNNNSIPNDENIDYTQQPDNPNPTTTAENHVENHVDEPTQIHNTKKMRLTLAGQGIEAEHSKTKDVESLETGNPHVESSVSDGPHVENVVSDDLTARVSAVENTTNQQAIGAAEDRTSWLIRALDFYNVPSPDNNNGQAVTGLTADAEQDRNFKLETKLMQALIHTRSLVINRK